MILVSLYIAFGIAFSATPPHRVTEFDAASGLLGDQAGAVISINGDGTITILPEGERKAKSFPLHHHLAAGRHQPKASAAYSYHVAQLQKGDIVSLHTYKEGKTTYCVDIQMRRRPGDLVPPSPVEKPDNPGAYHNLRNQDIAREALGLPPPVRANPLDLLPPDIKAQVLANMAKRPPREPPTNIVPPPRKIDK